MTRVFLLAPALALVLSGCLAKTALDVATAPVRIASKTVDVLTTSQSEADQKRGREVRQREEKLGKLQREYAREMASCQDGQSAACDRATRLKGQIDVLLPQVPVEAR